jgi:hypothetical protein
MIQVNGFFFEIYELDTETSILSRIASLLNTTPQFLYIEHPPTDWKIKQDLNIIVEDQLKHIRKLKNDKKMSNKIDKISKKINIDIHKIINDIENNPAEITNLIDQNKRLSDEYITKYKNLKKIKGIKYSDFIIKKISIELIINNINNLFYSLYDVFDIIITTDKIPIVIYDKFTKIYKKFNSDKQEYNNWDQLRTPDVILIKIISTTNINDPEFNNVLISSDKNNNFVIKFDILIENKYINQDSMINTILESLNINTSHPKISNQIYNNIGGEFTFLNQKLNIYIFSDLVMNNPLFSSLLVINESLKASKNRTDIFVIFTDPYYGETRVNLTPRIEEGNEYIRVKITKTTNIESVNSFINIMSKLFQQYNEQYPIVEKLYIQYAPRFDIITESDIKELESDNKNLFKLNPELFAKNYSRRCPNKVSVVKDKDVDELKREGVQLIRFPNSEKISKQYWYKCDDPIYKYPGLKDNNLEKANRDKYPYIPCCFKNIQTEKPKFKEYFNIAYNNEEKIDYKQSQHTILTSTKKMLKYDSIGKLPEEIQSYFKSIDPSWEYVRTGMDITTSSFIECLLKISDTNLPGSNISRKDIILTARSELQNFSICRQQCYDITTNMIKNISIDEEQYFDPKIFISLLEDVYGVNIYLFERIGNKTEMIIPRYTHGYYRLYKKIPSVCILIHRGSEIDLSPYPQCELICRYKPDEQIKYLFKHNSDISESLSDTFNKLTLSYSLENKIIPIKFPWPENIDIISQVIDSYGKTRLINIKNADTDETLMLMTSPIPPFGVPEIKFDTNVKKNTFKMVTKFIKLLNIQDIYQFVPENKLKTSVISGKIGNVDIIIPIIESDPKEDIPIIKEGITTYSDQPSIIDLYNKNKKIAQYVSEYFYWMFSNHVDGNSLEYVIENQDAIIIEFVKDKVEIKKDFEYNPRSKKFTIDNKSGVIENSKFIAKSKEMIKRLVYILKLEIKFNINNLMNYKNTPSINNFYNNASDFKQYPIQVILEGNNSIEKWLNEQNKSFILIDHIKDNLTEPYFFQNNLIDKNIVLLQNTDDIDTAIHIAVEWQLKNVNIGLDIKTKQDYVNMAFTLYTYESSDEINNIQIKGEQNTYDIRIIGWKHNITSKNMFSVILKL